MRREKVILRNSKRIQEFLNEGKSLIELIRFIKQENISSLKYDLSESAINGFCYQLMNQGKNEEALELLKLNTELFPNGFNAFYSYGECLLLLGDKENAIMRKRNPWN